MRLLVGTHNRGKLAEIKTVLGAVADEILSLGNFPLSATPFENASSYSENAAIKATSYALQTGLLTLADDSGLEVEALNWEPGVLSARYAGEGASDAERRVLLLSEIMTVESENRHARFVCGSYCGTGWHGGQSQRRCLQRQDHR